MSLVALCAAGDATPVFLVHGVGGTVLGYRELAARLPARSCFGIEARGIDGQEAPLDCVEALAAAYLDDIRAQGAPAAWLLAGWSFGGVVAFEMSLQLARAGVNACAALLDSRGLAERHRGPLPARAAKEREILLHLPPSGEANGAALEALRATHAAHLDALARYRPGRTRAPLLVVRASEAPGVTNDDLGFAAVADGPLDTLALRTDHDGLLTPPAVALVAQALGGFFAKWDRA